MRRSLACANCCAISTFLADRRPVANRRPHKSKSAALPITLLFAGFALLACGGARASGPVLVGADPSGKADSTAAVAKALAAACGRELDIPAGIYLVAAFKPCSGTSVKGAGVGATILRRLAAFTRTDGAPLVVVPSGGELENLTVDLNAPALGNWISGVGPQGSTTGVVIRNVSIKGASFNGLDWDDSAGAWSHRGTVIENVMVTDSGWEGAKLSGIIDGHASGLRVTSSGRDAIALAYDNRFSLISAHADKSKPPPLIYAGPGNPASAASTTPNTITSRGKVTFSVPAGMALGAGQAVYAYATRNPANFILGAVAAYAGTTLTIAASASGGEGAFSAWTIVGEDGMLIFRSPGDGDGVRIISPVVNDNRHARSDGIGIGEVGTSSSTPVAIGVGARAFTVADAGLEYRPGQSVMVLSSAAPTEAWMQGVVVSYVRAQLTVNVTAAHGAGVHADWVLNTEPGIELISNARVTRSGLFGIDLASNDTLDGALIDTPAVIGLYIGLDRGGALRRVSASNVRVRNAGLQGVHFASDSHFQSIQDVALSGIDVSNDTATPTGQGVEVNGSHAIFTGVKLDNSSSSYSRGVTSQYFFFGGGPDPHLDRPRQGPGGR